MTGPRRQGHRQARASLYIRYMRLIIPLLAACLIPLPVFAWEAGTQGPLCTLTHSEPGAEIRLTYDSRGPEYTITLTAPSPWPRQPVFTLRFEGGPGLAISTDRHILSPDGRSLTVIDRGFGNVLRGLAENRQATGLTGPGMLSFSLDGAAPEVAKFEACGTAPSV